MIDYLMNTTADGATVLQAILLSVLLIIVICLFAKQIVDSVKYVQKELDETKTEVDQQEIFKQINHHVPINGYRVFSEDWSGTRYTVTLLSKNNKRCILAETENIADPNGVIKIIAF